MIHKQYSIECVIDKNKKLYGSRLESGEIVLSPGEGLQQAEIVLIINRNYYEEIRQIVKEKDDSIGIMNMDIYLLSEFLVEECLE